MNVFEIVFELQILYYTSTFDNIPFKKMAIIQAKFPVFYLWI